MSNVAEILRGLPHGTLLSDEAISRFISKCRQINEDPVWHALRCGSIGGSEAGALFHHYFGNAIDGNSEDSFKDIYEISRNKLLIQLPEKPSVYALRGRELEPLIRAIFERRHPGLTRDQIAIDKCKSHSQCIYMKGNIDDAFLNGQKKILIDYKSSVNEYTIVPFTHVAQINHYAEIGRSNDHIFDEAYTVGLHAPEDLFEGLRMVTNNRKTNPEAFERWVQIIASENIPGLRLKSYYVPISEKIGKLLVTCANNFFSDYILKGKPVQTQKKSIELFDEHRVMANVKLATIASLVLNKNVIEEKINNHLQDLKSILPEEKLNNIAWPDDLPVNVKVKRDFDIDLAVQVLKDNGAADYEIYKQSESVDVNRLTAEYLKLIEKLKSMGETVEAADIYNRIPNIESIVSSLEKLGLEADDFVKDESISVYLSRKNIFQPIFINTKLEISSYIDEDASNKAKMLLDEVISFSNSTSLSAN